MDVFEDRTGYFEIFAAYAKPDWTCKEFSYKVPIVFADKPKGELSPGWNRIIMLDGETKTLAEYPETERINVWNKNYVEIAKIIKKVA